ncbi:hypothetical protein CDAR_70791 [Caerostris darwini]|uniref:Ribosomal protein S4 n=1 Tax=Caerostris darwini TaxID=1538125 RepID=A0AAV4WDQ1_9ARAC|nr:hypothetical protein CDAR_70791 [Caerostris darwini]
MLRSAVCLVVFFKTSCPRNILGGTYLHLEENIPFGDYGRANIKEGINARKQRKLQKKGKRERLRKSFSLSLSKIEKSSTREIKSASSLLFPRLLANQIARRTSCPRNILGHLNICEEHPWERICIFRRTSHFGARTSKKELMLANKAFFLLKKNEKQSAMLSNRIAEERSPNEYRIAFGSYSVRAPELPVAVNPMCVLKSTPPRKSKRCGSASASQLAEG